MFVYESDGITAGTRRGAGCDGRPRYAARDEVRETGAGADLLTSVAETRPLESNLTAIRCRARQRGQCRGASHGIRATSVKSHRGQVKVTADGLTSYPRTFELL